MQQSYDLVAIGGGSGGLAVARRVARYGASAAIIEASRLGGTCVNVGCVPKKVMWNAAQTADRLRQAPDYGFDLDPDAVRLDWGLLKQRRDAYVARLNGIYARNLSNDGVTLYRGEGRFVGPQSLVVVAEDGSETRIDAKHVVIATGGRPTWPSIPGAEVGIDSDGFFALETLPQRAVVVGAGYIAVELAGVLAALGTQVSLVVRRDAPLRGFDTCLREGLVEALGDQGIELVTQFVPARVDSADGEHVLVAEDGRRLPGLDTLIWAIGRHANTARLDLHAAGVKYLDNGNVPVDAWQTTNVAGIHALGDITGAPALTPVAIAAGRRLADRLFGGRPESRLPSTQVPTVVFSHPPIGTVGLTEEAARQRFGDASVEVFHSQFVPMEYALGEHKPKTRMAVITTGPSRKIVGIHVIGPGADEMLQGFAVAVNMGATKDDLDATVAIHPTSAEELVTIAP